MGQAVCSYCDSNPFEYQAPPSAEVVELCRQLISRGVTPGSGDFDKLDEMYKAVIAHICDGERT